MGRALRMFGYVLLLLLGGIILLFVFGPKEPVALERTFDAETIGEDPDAYLAAREAQHDDIIPGAQKAIVWAGEPGQRTEIALVYVHGFSATAHEIRPVSQRVAQALGANLYFARLTGHGRGGDAMAEAAIADWVHDFDEALAMGERLGERVVVIATSTGGTLAAAAMAEGRDSQVDGLVMLSPNFRIANPAARVLTLPAARHWVPVVMGRERGFEPLNEDHARMWTTRYPTTALFPMAQMVEHVANVDLSAIETPALILFSPLDEVVDPVATRETAARWGGDVTLSEQVLGEGDDPFNHVIAGDALSPGMTARVAEEITAWIEGLR